MWSGQFSFYFSVFLTIGQGEAAACQSMLSTNNSPAPQRKIHIQPPLECKPSANSVNSVPDYVPIVI